MTDYDYDYDDEPQGDDEWRPGECDHCYGGDENGVTADGPLGPLYCACLIGEGAAEDDCHCGPVPEEMEGGPCPVCAPELAAAYYGTPA